MRDYEFSEKIELIKSNSNEFYQDMIDGIPIVDFNYYCLRISQRTGISFDEVRYLMRKNIRRNNNLMNC